MATTSLHPATPAYRSRLYEWLTTTDHKKIGILYLVNSMVFFFAGGALAMVVRLQLVIPKSDTVMGGLVSAEFYNQAFTMHASFMLFLFIIPILAGFGNSRSRSRSGRRTWPSRGSTPCRSGCCRWAGC